MKYNLKNVMNRAWEIKRQDSANIFSECLKMAWDEVHNSIKVFLTSYKTPKGNSVEIEIMVEHITRETSYADGWNVSVPCSRYRYSVSKLIFNGKQYPEADFDNVIDQSVVRVEYVGRDRRLIRLPANFVEAFTEQENKELDEIRERNERSEAAYEAHCEMMRKAMSY